MTGMVRDTACDYFLRFEEYAYALFKRHRSRCNMLCLTQQDVQLTCCYTIHVVETASLKHCQVSYENDGEYL